MTTSKKINHLMFKKRINNLEKRLFKQKIFNHLSNKTALHVNNGQFPTLNEMRRFLIDEALIRTKNNQTKAARLLGISRQALYNRLQQYKETNKIFPIL